MSLSLTLFIDEPCPKCRKPIRQMTIDVHPTNRDLALHVYECPDCQIRGPIQRRRPRCWLSFC